MAYKTKSEIQELQAKLPELACKISLRGFHVYNVFPIPEKAQWIAICDNCLDKKIITVKD